MEKKVSEQIKDFLDFLDRCGELNAMAYSAVGEEDRRHQDLVHAIEFEEDPDKIAQIGMRIHQSRVERRIQKNICGVTAPVVEYALDPQNKKSLDRMRQLLGNVRKEENYQENRVYTPRLKENWIYFQEMWGDGRGQKDPE